MAECGCPCLVVRHRQPTVSVSLLALAISTTLAIGIAEPSSAADPRPDARLRYIDLALPDAARRALQDDRKLDPNALRAELQAQKQALQSALNLTIVSDYDHLPLLLVALSSEEQEQQIKAQPGVEAVWPVPILHASISATDSANQMQAGLAAQAGFNAAGTSILVTDSALDAGPPSVIHPDFGVCTAVGSPTSCQLRSWQTLETTGSNAHGTNVAAIVARTARAAGIHFADIGIAGTGVSSSSAFTALNWAVQNQAAENIVAHNMSWGGSSPCAMSSNTFLTAKSAGIIQVAAAGNDSSNSQVVILDWPACNPHVVAVGSVNTTGPNWSVSSFSNSESVLGFLAPGDSIVAGGYNYTGTSMASPHVAGAMAIMRASGAWSSISIDELVSHMRAQGRWIVDSRTGQSFPVPMLFDARPIKLYVENRFSTSYSLGQPAMQSCGVDCYHYARNAASSINVPDPEISTLNCNPGSGPCNVTMDVNRDVVLMPGGVLVALTSMLAAPNTFTPEVDLFADGFEP